MHRPARHSYQPAHTGREQSMRRRIRPPIILVVLGFLAAGVRAEPINGTIYFTTYNPINAAGGLDFSAAGFNEHKVDYTYDGVGAFALGPRVAVARTNGADGIIFHPDGSLLVGGQSSGFIHKVDPVTGTST